MDADDFWESNRKGRTHLKVYAPTDPEHPLLRFYEALQGRNVPVLARIAWVANHLHIPTDRIDDDEPPDYGAVTMLSWANQNEDAFRTIYESKLIPNKQQLEIADRPKDNGQTLALIEALDAEFSTPDAQSPD